MHSYLVGVETYIVACTFLTCPYLVCASSKGSGEAVCLRRLVWALAPNIFVGDVRLLRGSRKFFSDGGSNFEIFLVNEWIQIPQKLNHHRPASETPFKWRFAGVPMMAKHWMLGLGSFVIFQGIRTGIAKKRYNFVIFQGDPEPLSPLWIRTWD